MDTDASTDGAAGLDNAASVDRSEVEKFGKDAEHWWDGSGKFRPLHVLNPTRIAIIKSAIAGHFDREPKALRPFDGLNLLDLGCGGGLIAEPMARLGAKVTGVDPSAASINVASAHAGRMGLSIDYIVGSGDDLAAAGQSFDIVLALEIAEHVASPPDFIRTTAQLVAPGGLMVVSTINRTLSALALAKIAAEYVLNWVPRGTHQFRRFVTVREMRSAFEAAGLMPQPPVGMTYRPLKDEWRRSLDTNVNYVMWASKT